jgi:hypothetical protein
MPLVRRLTGGYFVPNETVPLKHIQLNGTSLTSHRRQTHYR